MDQSQVADNVGLTSRCDLLQQKGEYLTSALCVHRQSANTITCQKCRVRKQKRKRKRTIVPTDLWLRFLQRWVGSLFMCGCSVGTSAFYSGNPDFCFPWEADLCFITLYSNLLLTWTHAPRPAHYLSLPSLLACHPQPPVTAFTITCLICPVWPRGCTSWIVDLEMLGAAYPLIQCNIPEDLNLQQHSCENLKSCTIVVLSDWLWPVH